MLLFAYGCVPAAEFGVFLMENSAENGNVLTKKSLDALWEIDALVLGIEVSFIARPP